MIFQTLDDKAECVGVYIDGKLHFDTMPENLTVTWSNASSISNDSVQFVSLWVDGKDLSECCPAEHIEEFRSCQNKLRAYLKSF